MCVQKKRLDMETNVPPELPTSLLPHFLSQFFLLFHIRLEEGRIHHSPVARPNEAAVCLPNGTWAPSVIGKQMQRHVAFTLPAPVRRQRGGGGITFDLSPCVSLFACCENTTVQRGLLHCHGQAECLRPRGSVQQLLFHGFPQRSEDSVTYVCVVRNVGWMRSSAARQLGSWSWSWSRARQALFGSTSWLLRQLHCHGLKASLTTVNLGFILLTAKHRKPRS